MPTLLKNGKRGLRGIGRLRIKVREWEIKTGREREKVGLVERWKRKESASMKREASAKIYGSKALFSIHIRGLEHSCVSTGEKEEEEGRKGGKDE